MATNETIDARANRVHRRVAEVAQEVNSLLHRVGSACAQYAGCPDELRDVYRGQMLQVLADAEIWMMLALREEPAYTAKDKLDDLNLARPLRRGPRC